MLIPAHLDQKKKMIPQTNNGNKNGKDGKDQNDQGADIE